MENFLLCSYLYKLQRLRIQLLSLENKIKFYHFVLCLEVNHNNLFFNTFIFQANQDLKKEISTLFMEFKTERIDRTFYFY